MNTLQLEKIELSDPRVAFVEAKPAGWSGDLPVKKLYKELERRDIPKEYWPPVPTDNRCLERALQSVRTKNSLVRPLAKGRGFSIILEKQEELDLEKDSAHQAHTVELTCKVERTEFDQSISTVRFTPDNHPAIPFIQAEFNRFRGSEEGGGLFKCAQDLSFWFSQIIIPWCHGVATRSRGGSYYIQKGVYLDRIIAVNAALEAASLITKTHLKVGGNFVEMAKVVEGGRIILKPEFASHAAIEILVDNIISECDSTCDALFDKISNPNIGMRGLETQADHALELEKKLTEHEKLLDTSLTDLRNRINEIKAGIGAAQLKLLTEHDYLIATKKGK